MNNIHNDIVCGSCGSACAETKKEVRKFIIKYHYSCPECGEGAVIIERRCNCGSEYPAKTCPEGNRYCG